MSLTKYLIRRALYLVPVFFGITFLVFSIERLAGDPVKLLTAGQTRSEERRVGKECRVGWWTRASSRRRHTRLQGDWSSDVCSSDLGSKVNELNRGYPTEDYLNVTDEIPHQASPLPGARLLRHYFPRLLNRTSRWRSSQAADSRPD